ncbi:putative type I restriction enzymeP M protein [Candidatus Mycoplasma haematohominis]|uniref:site-specific DNA-methyltransferase (adenine-specific) n=1 Tax=Candidatus Mycoplasma haematohominis TaxID=1494318 RepID=A0A478FQ91_9MOLU|nr:putative type I restriction enzymeP M protein [Candidatus Mycoplasma haemohominis]
MSSEVEKNELYKTIWDTANKLRGSVDGWDFKQYFLGLMFYRYVSEDFVNYINDKELKQGKENYNYLDRAKYKNNHGFRQIESIKEEKGFYIHSHDLFENMLKSHERNCSHLNEALLEAFERIEQNSEEEYQGLFKDIDVNSKRLEKTVEARNQKIIEVMRNVKNLKIDLIDQQESDIFGDAYEYLMAMYASNAGKSGGEYYTPTEVSELMVKLVLENKKDVKTIYDPACGSGSLLLKFVKVLKQENADLSNLEIYGQEINNTTYNLCRMNILLHGIHYKNFDIACADTLVNPCDRHNKKFDGIVSNPPYSVCWKGNDDPKLVKDPRFSCAGALAPKSKADLAFVMHCLYHLEEKGAAAIITFPGVMYRGGAEQKIRKYLVDNNYVDCVIQLAENFFYGTSISTCIIVLKKSKKEKKTLFINASEQFEKIKNKNRLTPENINWILDIYRQRKNIDYISKLVDNSVIEQQDYGLSVSSYVEKEDKREKIEIDVLNSEIERIVENTNKLRRGIKEIIGDL